MNCLALLNRGRGDGHDVQHVLYAGNGGIDESWAYGTILRVADAVGRGEAQYNAVVGNSASWRVAVDDVEACRRGT